MVSINKRYLGLYIESKNLPEVFLILEPNLGLFCLTEKAEKKMILKNVRSIKMLHLKWFS